MLLLLLTTRIKNFWNTSLWWTQFKSILSVHVIKLPWRDCFLFFSNKLLCKFCAEAWRIRDTYSHQTKFCAKEYRVKISLNKLCIIKSASITITFFSTCERKWMMYYRYSNLFWMKDQEKSVSSLYFCNILLTFFTLFSGKKCLPKSNLTHVSNKLKADYHFGIFCKLFLIYQIWWWSNNKESFLEI